ncbi:hypothetical protein P2G88_07515 [Aliiglaciecola sp. CAU 1673]|uniref:hypothetical protein n=1 Tax=Aliiglaciecola sp. CAU 1673 TaxID=3032595 RepID=UPI0023DB77CF|nr:hypothetical protein [Aliiglaciecola sp. CAU 1673]MDF2178099.1 hypothetical protein [Aliiglaciecola sp. CAU 1673]
MNSLQDEIKRLQEASFKVMLYSIGLVGGIIGTSREINETTVVGSGFVFLASLAYLISTARKIFVISAYLSTRTKAPDEWHCLIPELNKRFSNWFETQNIALVYLLVSFCGLAIFIQKAALYAAIFFLMQAALCAILYSIPGRVSKYKENIEKMLHQHSFSQHFQDRNNL